MVAWVGEKAENFISVPSIILFSLSLRAALFSGPIQPHRAVKPPKFRRTEHNIKIKDKSLVLLAPTSPYINHRVFM